MSNLEQTKEFQKRVKKETEILAQLLQSGKTLKNNFMGYEVEGWVLKEDFSPSATSHLLVNNLKHQQIVPELSRYNFEINGTPFKRDKNILKNFATDMNKLWQTCQNEALKNGSQVLMIGSPPTLTSEMLNMDVLTPDKRYEELCTDIMRLRGNNPLKLHICGKDILIKNDIGLITECSATSLQIHLGCPAEEFQHYFNASLFASPFSVAVAANSPYLFGHELWDETRIPVFQQTADVTGRVDQYGRRPKRVSFGNGYLKNSVVELFERNLNYHPPLVLRLFDTRPEELNHLMYHNGTIWRWNRPIVGLAKDGTPHFRIEHRVPPAGPTVDDMVANTALYLGMTLHFSKMAEEIIAKLTFEKLSRNFYDCCRTSLDTEITWLDGQKYNVADLLLNRIIPAAKNELLEQGLDSQQVSYYIDEVMTQRILKRQNGANWQKRFVHTHGKNFAAMIEAYHHYQREGIPVWRWEV